MTPPTRVPPVLRRAWPSLRLLGGAAVLGVLLWRFGGGPFVEAWHRTTWPAVLASVVLTCVATAACAWRWRVIAARLGVPMSMRSAVTAYYRSQFLNSVLPGGVLGDADRAVRHGRHVGDLPAGLRSAAWDRVTGQVVQIALLLLALVVLPSPLRRLASVAALAVLVIGVTGWALHRRGGSRADHGWLVADVRRLADARASGQVAAGSLVSSAAHVAVFLVAAAAVGVTASWSVLVPTALLVLVLSAVPVNVAGWGPREGLTAWAFATVGLVSADGLTVSVVYGVLATLSTLPGALVLLVDTVVRRRTRSGHDSDLRADRPLEEVHRG